jgi:hypothetical protein
MSNISALCFAILRVRNYLFTRSCFSEFIYFSFLTPGFHKIPFLFFSPFPVFRFCLIVFLFSCVATLSCLSHVLCVFSSLFLPAAFNCSSADCESARSFPFTVSWSQDASCALRLFTSAYRMCNRVAVSWISNVQLSSCFRRTVGRFPPFGSVTCLSCLFRNEISWINTEALINTMLQYVRKRNASYAFNWSCYLSRVSSLT